MVGGESSSVGIVFYDTSKPGENAVFCFFENDEPRIKTGERKKLLDEMSEKDGPFCHSDRKRTLRLLGYAFLFYFIFIAAVWVFIGGFFPVFGAFLFSVLAFFPSLVLCFSMMNLYPEEEAFRRFRRFHGAEHMLISYYFKHDDDFSAEKVSKTSVFNRECGTVYASSAVVLAAVIGISFAFLPEIGFLRFLGIIFLAAAVLFIDILNPLNPLLIFQKNAVEKPDEKTLLLAAKGFETLVKTGGTNEN